MSVITKQIELTPQDVIEALRSFEEEEWTGVLTFLEAERPHKYNSHLVSALTTRVL
jgi:hypothetical protein